MGTIFHGLTMDPEWLLHRSMYTLLIVAGSYLRLRWAQVVPAALGIRRVAIRIRGTILWMRINSTGRCAG